MDIKAVGNHTDPCVYEYVIFDTMVTFELFGRLKLEKSFDENKDRSVLNFVTFSDNSFAIAVFKNNFKKIGETSTKRDNGMNLIGTTCQKYQY